jgi:hypothetical protein
LRLQVLYFRMNADSFFHTVTQTVISLLPGLCGTPFGAILVFPGAARLERHSLMNIASAFAAAPDARLIFSRESNRTEDGAACVANLPRENTVLLEECVRLLCLESHVRPSEVMSSFMRHPLNVLAFENDIPPMGIYIWSAVNKFDLNW